MDEIFESPEAKIYKVMHLPNAHITIGTELEGGIKSIWATKTFDGDSNETAEFAVTPDTSAELIAQMTDMVRAFLTELLKKHLTE